MESSSMDLSIIIPVFNTKIVEFKNCIKSIIDKEKNFCYEISKKR